MKVDRQIKIPLYMQIYESLLKKITNREFQYGEYLPSERELGSLYKVDRLTVRKALEMLVNEGLVEKKAGIGTRVKELPAHIVSSESSRNIVFILPKSVSSADRITEPFISKLFYGIENECKKHGYYLMYTTLDEGEELNRILGQANISGILFVSEIHPRFYDEVQRVNVPVVVINKNHDRFTSILGDREKGHCEVVRHLLSLGHERISFIKGIPSYSTTKASFDGYKRALMDRGIDWEGQQIKTGDWTFDSGYHAMREILEEADPTAIAACNDMMALGAIEAIREFGYSVPKDVSVTGFDDIEQCKYAIPKLTTVRVDTELLARMACQNLFYTIENGTANNVKVVVPAELVIRESTSQAG